MYLAAHGLITLLLFTLAQLVKNGPEDRKHVAAFKARNKSLYVYVKMILFKRTHL
jgi:hypothetical protein